MAVSKRLRYEILRRDDHTCRYCGQGSPKVQLTVDHVVPTALGGSDKPENLVAACRDCNAGKSASSPDAPLVADVAQKAVQWAQAMEVVLERRTAELADERARVARFETSWDSWTSSDGDPAPKDGNWKNSVRRFMAAGLDDEFLTDAVNTALGNRRIRSNDGWRYFCGICWNEIRGLQDRASEYASAPIVSSPPPAGAADEEEITEFPLMEAFTIFLDDVMSMAKFPEDARRILRRSMWDDICRASIVFDRKSFGSAEEDADFLVAWGDEEDPPSGWDMASEALGMYVAYSMYHAGELIRQDREGGVPGGS